MSETHRLVEHFFRHESARLVASLARSLGPGRLDLAEDVVQAALGRALASWSLRGVPHNPGAWLTRVARNLALDALRRDQRWSRLVENLPAVASADDAALIDDDPKIVQDDLLRMIFVCCDPRVPVESQIALALKTLCGFGVREIARSLLTTEANVAKRLVRAKKLLREEGVGPDLTAEAVRERLPSVLSVVYLLFTEGHSSTREESLVRVELCEEAVRLALTIAEHPLTRGPETAALLALLLFHVSRLDARLDDAGELLRLADQDRAHWDRRLIAEAFRWFARSAGGAAPPRYHAEPWIAADHCRAASFAETDWDRIVRGYDLLVRLAPSPFHELNRAIAVAERDGPDAGWTALARVDAGALAERTHLWAATAGELARRRGDVAEAETQFRKALAAAPTRAERAFLQAKLAALK